jgi:subtilase family serine protease
MMRRSSLTRRVAVLAGACAVGVPAASAIASGASGTQGASRASGTQGASVASGTQGASGTSGASGTQEVTRLAGSDPEISADSPELGPVSGTENRTIEVWMAGDQQAAQQFVDAVSTSGSPSYHQFVSPSDYTKRFGPSPAQVKAVESYLTGAGFTAVKPSAGGDYVSATAPVSRINRAFSVQIRNYGVAGAGGRHTTIESNDRELTFPASISSDILAVTGLNTTQPQSNAASATGARAKGSACSRYWAQKTHAISPPFRGLTKAAVAICGYSARQVRAAYGLSAADTGKGKTIALIQVGAPDKKMFQTLVRYAKVNGLPAPRAGQYREHVIGDHRKCLNGALEEAVIDSEAAYAMAPRANQLVVDGDECDTREHGAQALFDAMLAPLTGKRSRASAAIESVSYGLPTTTEGTTPASELKVSHAIALRAAAEGVSLLVSSGDAPGVEPPASDPDLTAVGGTTLGIGAHSQRVFETGWSTAFGERTGTSGPWQDKGILLGASGGVSRVYREPGYQHGVVPSAMVLGPADQAGRTVPDIAADADPATGMLFGLIITHANGKTTRYTPYTNAGTSLAAPLIAGIVADAEQGRRRNLGFLNPLLYSLAGTRAYHDTAPLRPSDPDVNRAFYKPGLTDINHKFARGFLVGVNDAQDRSGTDQVTAPGYDTMTGLGTPNGPAFIKALRSGK